jgi:ribosome-binding protein aMBF1 (putative translation factor)
MDAAFSTHAVPSTAHSGARKVKQLKSRKLRKAGWRSGSVKDFLKLSDEEAALVEMRLALSRNLRERRVGGGLSQSDLAARMGSSQSRIAKMEAADSSVSLDLLIRSLLALGASTKDIARALGR